MGDFTNYGVMQVDGTWEIEYGEKVNLCSIPMERKRIFHPVTEEDLRKIRGFVENGIGLQVAR